MTCEPMGLPREGTPRRIFQTVNDITMLYTTSDYGGGNREFRVIPGAPDAGLVPERAYCEVYETKDISG